MTETSSPPLTDPNFRKALVVDDHPDIAASMTAMLKTFGYTTEAARDGIDALRVAATFHPSIVFLDISMPKLDGFDACSVIRAQPWAENVRLIAVTGLPEDEVQQRYRTAGFDDYLLKPVGFEEVRKVLG